MYRTQSTPRPTIVRAFAALVAAIVLFAPLAMAADQTLTTTVAATNTLSITGGATVLLSPTVGTPAVDEATGLAFDTNDGSTYKITVVATVWAFSPTVVSMAANTFPVLRFVSATSTAGTPSTVAGELINATNVVSAAVPVVTAITSASGTATVTLDASITQTVVAGTYSTTLTYVLVAN